MVLRRRKRADDEIVKVNGADGSTYEEHRQQRIKENNERMRKLGIFDLSLNLKSLTAPTPKSSQNVKLPKSSLALSTSTRRSSRLRSVNPVDYSVSDFYTTIYDPVKGETCHQCRQKTASLHTHCSCCNTRQGRFCERCLRTRYGEKMIKVNKDANWVCPVCRGICNCFRCRKAKGLAPIGNIYGKVSKLGLKSVAHYLIHTQQVKTQPEDTGVEISESEERDLSFSNKAKMEEVEEEKMCCSDAMKRVDDTDALNEKKTREVRTQPENTGVAISEAEERYLSFSNKAKMEEVEEEKMCCSDAMKCVDDTDALNEKKTREVRTQPEDTGVEISEAEERDLSFSNKAKVEEEEEEKVCCSDSMKCVDDTYAFDENKTWEVSELNL